MLQEQKAIVGRDVGELQELLDAGAGERDWSWRGNERRTALELAAVIGQQEMVKLLTEAGANTNHLSASGYSALHHASMWGQLDCVKELVRAGADHRLRTKSGETSQQLALRYRNTACSDYLSSVEARRVLNEAAQEARGMLADSELIAGRWNKEDKAKVTALCQEKEQWLAHSEECFEEIVHQTNDFRVRIQPYFDKLQLISRKTG